MARYNRKTAIAPQRTQYSEEQKAAVMAALLMGQSISTVAKEYKIPEGTVKRWSASAKERLEPVRSAKNERIGDLIIEYVSAALLTLTRHMDYAADEAYVKKQPAGEFAVLHGVIADKTIRILEAIAPEPSADATELEPDPADTD